MDLGLQHIALVSETYPPELNSIALHAQRSLRYLRSRGHAVELIRPRQPGDASNEQGGELLLAGVAMPHHPDIRIGLPARRILQRRWSMHAPAVVHLATAGPLGWSALQAARALNIPVTTEYRRSLRPDADDEFLLWRHPLATYMRSFHGHAALTFVASKQEATRLQADGYQNLCVIGRAVDHALFNPERRSLLQRRRWGLGDEDLAVLHVGRLNEEKNIALAVQAFEAVRSVQPRARMIWVGDGPLRAKLMHAHPDHVYQSALAGEALAACYASSDLFLFPSLSESFGNVSLEALASGLTLLAFDYGAAATYAQHDCSACLTPYADREAFVQNARRLAMDAGLRNRLRAAARGAVLALDWRDALDHFEQRLLSVAQRSVRNAAQHENRRSV